MLLSLAIALHLHSCVDAVPGSSGWISPVECWHSV